MAKTKIPKQYKSIYADSKLWNDIKKKSDTETVSFNAKVAQYIKDGWERENHS